MRDLPEIDALREKMRSLDLISYREAAEIARCSAMAVHRAVRSGALVEPQTVGKKRGLNKHDVVRWFQERKHRRFAAAIADIVHSGGECITLAELHQHYVDRAGASPCGCFMFVNRISTCYRCQRLFEIARLIAASQASGERAMVYGNRLRLLEEVARKVIAKADDARARYEGKTDPSEHGNGWLSGILEASDMLRPFVSATIERAESPADGNSARGDEGGRRKRSVRCAGLTRRQMLQSIRSEQRRSRSRTFQAGWWDDLAFI